MRYAPRAAASTASAWPGTFTLRHARTSRAVGTEQEGRALDPHIVAAVHAASRTHTPNASQALPSSSLASATVRSYLAVNLRVLGGRVLRHAEHARAGRGEIAGSAREILRLRACSPAVSSLG